MVDFHVGERLHDRLIRKQTILKINLAAILTTSMANTGSTSSMEQQLLPPALFWAFIPIVLSTMMQPSVRALGLPRWYSIVLRISPVICCVYAVSTLVEVVCRMYRLGSIERALRHVAAKRFKDGRSTRKTSKDANVHDGEFDRLRGNSDLRIGIFAITAFPQAIKLYACKGIPGAKICCTAFIVAFVVDEVLLRFTSDSENSEETQKTDSVPVDESIASFRHSMPTMLNGEHLVYFSSFLFDILLVRSMIGSTSRVLFVCLWIFAIQIGLLAIVKYDNDFVASLNILWSCIYAGVVAAKSFFSTSLTTAIFVVLATSGGLFLLGLMASELEERWTACLSPKIERPLATYVILNHVVAALLFLRLVYDSADTFTPSWTYWLG